MLHQSDHQYVHKKNFFVGFGIVSSKEKPFLVVVNYNRVKLESRLF